MFVSLDAFVSAVSFLSIASKMGQNRKYVRVLQVTRRCDDVANVTENMSEIESASVRGSGKENEKENETWNVSSGKGGITRRQKIADTFARCTFLASPTISCASIRITYY
jgi:mannose/fructose/N-acetylgalactosamine-specific phosphotransferase system component IIB